MSIQASITRTLSTIQDRMPERFFAWNGERIPCIPSGDQNAYQIQSGGFIGNPGTVLLVIWELWKGADSTLVTVDSSEITVDTAFESGAGSSQVITDEEGGGVQDEGGSAIATENPQTGIRQPVAGKRLTYRGRDYRIDSAKLSAFGSHVVLNLGDVNR